METLREETTSLQQQLDRQPDTVERLARLLEERNNTTWEREKSVLRASTDTKAVQAVRERVRRTAVFGRKGRAVGARLVRAGVADRRPEVTGLIAPRTSGVAAAD